MRRASVGQGERPQAPGSANGRPAPARPASGGPAASAPAVTPASTANASVTAGAKTAAKAGAQLATNTTAKAGAVRATPGAGPVAAGEATLRANAGSWGWLPALVLLAALGLVTVEQAMRLALNQAPGADLLFWLGILLIYAPVAFRMALPQTPRRERIALAVWLGLALYLVKILRSPAGFTFHDEFPHYATADAIMRTQHLFSPNSLQAVSAYFPGLELVTAALAGVGGLSIEAAGLVVVGAARLIAALAIYLLYEEISGSPRVAGIGSVLAITYPNYVFWSSQYGYESLALPLAILVLLLGLYKSRRNASRDGASRDSASRNRATRVGLTVMMLVLMAAVVITHHITSYFLAVTLLALLAVTRYGRPLVAFAERVAARVPKAVRRLLPWTLWTRLTEHGTAARDWTAPAFAAFSFVVIWLAIVGREVVAYLAPHIQTATAGLVGLIGRSNSARTPFTTSAATTPAPTWEQLVAFAAVLLILGVIPFGLLQVWRRYRRHGMGLLFGLVTLAYPFTLVLRLSGGGSEIANRSWDFLFIAFGFVLAAAVAEIWMTREHLMARAGVFASYAAILMIGATIVGSPDWARLPGPFMVGGDTRGLQPESYAATNWVRDTLGPDNGFIADYSNKLLLGSFGEQYILQGLSWVYLSPKLDPNAELADLVKRGAQYVVVDDRLTTQVPRIGHYFEPGEPGSPWREPLPVSDLTKFDRAPCLSRIFDSGHIIIYQVSAACAPGQGGTK